MTVNHNKWIVMSNDVIYVQLPYISMNIIHIYSDHMVLTHPWWLKSFSADAWSKAGWQTVQKHLQHNRTQPVGFSLSKRKNKNGMKTTRKQVPYPSRWAQCVALASVANWSLSAFQGAASSLQLGARTMVRRARLSSFRWAPWPKDEGHAVPRYWSNANGAGCC